MAEITADAAAELAIYTVAPSLGANAAELTDSQAFMSQILALDPASPGFATRVATAVKAAAEAVPRFRAAAPNGTATGAQSGQAQPPAQWTREDVQRASPTEVEKAMNDGLLVGLNIQPPRRRRGAA